MATTRFLVQHCLLQPGAVLQEIVPSSFAAVANQVLTNGGTFSPIEVNGLAIEAYQPEFQDWIEARTIQDLMASRKLRVVNANVAQEPAAPPMPTFTPPPLQPPPPAHEQQSMQTFMSPQAPPPPQAQAPPPPAYAGAAPTAPQIVSIKMEDVLLAIGSLPRSVEPSCSHVLEHLARQRVSGLGAMVEAGMRQCGHPTAWGAAVAQPTPVRPSGRTESVIHPNPSGPPHGTTDSGRPERDEKRRGIRVRDEDLSMLKTMFHKPTMRKSDVCSKIMQKMQHYRDNDKRNALLDVAIERGIITEAKAPGKMSDKLYTLVGDRSRNSAPEPSAIPEPSHGKPITSGDLRYLTGLFRTKTTAVAEIIHHLKKHPEFRELHNKKRLIQAGLDQGLIKGVGPLIRSFHDHYMLVGEDDELKTRPPPEQTTPAPVAATPQAALPPAPSPQLAAPVVYEDVTPSRTELPPPPPGIKSLEEFKAFCEARGIFAPDRSASKSESATAVPAPEDIDNREVEQQVAADELEDKLAKRVLAKLEQRASAGEMPEQEASEEGDANKRPREEQDPHPQDGEDELSQRRMRQEADESHTTADAVPQPVADNEVASGEQRGGSSGNEDKPQHVAEAPSSTTE